MSEHDVSLATNLCDDCLYREDCGIRDRILDTEEDTGVKMRVGYCPDFRDAESLDPEIEMDVCDRSWEVP
jgi:hypothetical protein